MSRTTNSSSAIFVNNTGDITWFVKSSAGKGAEIITEPWIITYED